MQKRNYFMQNKLGFANTYMLRWSYRKEIPGWERIKRKEAIELCVAERRRRNYDRDFGGYATAYIFPDWWYEEDHPVGWVPNGYIVEKGVGHFGDE